STYPALLGQLLSARYAPQTFDVQNAGCSGETVAAGGPCGGGVVRLPSVLSAANHPQVVLLLEGVNDLMSGNATTIPPLIDAIRTMVRQAKSVGVQVYLATLLPERDNGSRTGSMPLISPANVQIRQLASSEGVVLVDLFQGFNGSPDPYIDTDGLHPNAQ